MSDNLPALPEPDMCHRKALDNCEEEFSYSAELVREYVAAAVAAERERCASICDGIGAGYTGAARWLDGQHATHAAGQRDGANECAAAIRAG